MSGALGVLAVLGAAVVLILYAYIAVNARSEDRDDDPPCQ